MNNTIAFAENLKILRKEQKLTQKQLAAKLGVALSTVAMWETGAREPDYEMLNKIAQFFHVTYDMLLSSNPVKNFIDGSEEDELLELRDLLRNRPEMKMLFSISRNATRSDIEKTVAIIEALKDKY